MASATYPAVCAARESGEWTISSGRPSGTGRAGRSCGAASRSPASAPWRCPSGDSGVSDWPWKRFSTIHSDSPWRSRTSVASRPSGTTDAGGSGGAGGVVGHRAPSRRTTQTSITASSDSIAPDDRVRDVVVERQDHEGVGARRGPGERHRADVDVGLAEHRADPADRPRPVPVVADEHHVGGRQVHRVLLEPHEARLAVGDGPGQGHGLLPRLGGDRQQRRERAGVGRLALDDGDPPRPGEGRGVDEVDPLEGVVLEEAPQHGRDERGRVERRRLAGDLEGQRAGPAAQELRREPAEGLRERAGTARWPAPSRR